jgi:hypothetical protein
MFQHSAARMITGAAAVLLLLLPSAHPVTRAGRIEEAKDQRMSSPSRASARAGVSNLDALLPDIGDLSGPGLSPVTNMAMQCEGPQHDRSPADYRSHGQKGREHDAS